MADTNSKEITDVYHVGDNDDNPPEYSEVTERDYRGRAVGQGKQPPPFNPQYQQQQQQQQQQQYPTAPVTVAPGQVGYAPYAQQPAAAAAPGVQQPQYPQYPAVQQPGVQQQPVVIQQPGLGQNVVQTVPLQQAQVVSPAGVQPQIIAGQTGVIQQQPGAQQPGVIVVQPPLRVAPSNATSLSGHIAFACIVFWCCGWLFGGIAFILLMIAQDGRNENDRRPLVQASLGLNIAGLLIGIIVIITIAVILSAATAAAVG